MKKILIILVLLLVVISSSFANFTFSPVSLDPIHEIYNSSLWAPKLRFQYVMLLDQSGPDSVMVATPRIPGETYDNATSETLKYDYVYDEMPFIDEGTGQKSYLRLNTGVNMGLFSMSYDFDNFPTLSIEMSIQGTLNMVFESKGGTDLLGFDGVYFIGANFGIGDFFSLRAGTHHYSSHYGDEIIESLFTYGTNADKLLHSTKPTILLNYVRQDSIVIGVSGKPLSWLRLYGEVDFLPRKMVRIRPGIFAPDDTENKAGNTQVGEVYPQEGNTGGRKTPYGKGYLNMRCNAGIEFHIPISKLGNMIIGYDIEFIQEGQTKYQVGAYSPDNPWDIEHNVSLSQEIGPYLVLDVIYHHGRFPINNLYNFKCNFVSVGFSL